MAGGLDVLRCNPFSVLPECQYIRVEERGSKLPVSHSFSRSVLLFYRDFLPDFRCQEGLVAKILALRSNHEMKHG